MRTVLIALLAAAAARAADEPESLSVQPELEPAGDHCRLTFKLPKEWTASTSTIVMGHGEGKGCSSAMARQMGNCYSGFVRAPCRHVTGVRQKTCEVLVKDECHKLPSGEYEIQFARKRDLAALPACPKTLDARPSACEEGHDKSCPDMNVQGRYTFARFGKALDGCLDEGATVAVRGFEGMVTELCGKLGVLVQSSCAVLRSEAAAKLDDDCRSEVASAVASADIFPSEGQAKKKCQADAVQLGSAEKKCPLWKCARTGQ